MTTKKEYIEISKSYLTADDIGNNMILKDRGMIDTPLLSKIKRMFIDEFCDKNDTHYIEYSVYTIHKKTQFCFCIDAIFYDGFENKCIIDIASIDRNQYKGSVPSNILLSSYAKLIYSGASRVYIGLFIGGDTIEYHKIEKDINLASKVFNIKCDLLTTN